MTLILNNDDIASVLTMEETIDALRQAYEELARTEAVCRPRIDIRIPTSDPAKMYQWGTMEGGSASGYFAIRMKSDIVYEREYGGTRTEEKYCVQPGLFCGLILLMSVENGEPLAIINDGYLQHMRVGADSGIGAGYMAREDASVVAMIGSGGMARSHAESFAAVRDIKRIQVYSPTRANREAYAEEIRAKMGIEVSPGRVRRRGVQGRAHRRRVHGRGGARHLRQGRGGRRAHDLRRWAHRRRGDGAHRPLAPPRLGPRAGRHTGDEAARREHRLRGECAGRHARVGGTVPLAVRQGPRRHR